MAAVTMTTEPYPAQASGAPASLRLAGGLGAEGGAGDHTAGTPKGRCGSRENP